MFSESPYYLFIWYFLDYLVSIWYNQIGSPNQFWRNRCVLICALITQINCMEKVFMNLLPLLGACLASVDLILILKKKLNKEFIPYHEWLFRCLQFAVWVSCSYYVYFNCVRTGSQAELQKICRQLSQSCRGVPFSSTCSAAGFSVSGGLWSLFLGSYIFK